MQKIKLILFLLLLSCSYKPGSIGVLNEIFVIVSPEDKEFIKPIMSDLFDEIIYTKGVGISGKIRFAEISNEVETTTKKVNETVSTIPEHQINNNEYSGQNFSGYVWAEDFLRTTNNNNYMEILVEFSKKYTTTTQSTLPYACDPTYRSEDIFFSSAVLGRVYKYTKESKYSTVTKEYCRSCNCHKK